MPPSKESFINKSSDDQISYVGIDTLQEQIRRKALKRGFQFNLMVAGRSGLGKTTLVNTLFRTSFPRQESDEDPIIPSTTEIRVRKLTKTEGGVRLTLSFIDTPGFGDHINNEACWKPLIEYIEHQYEAYLKEEQEVNRSPIISDTRVHCCIYFISPSGHSLSSLDIEVLKRLDKIVNLVPVISKADSLTIEERLSFKMRIREDLEAHRINTYPATDLDEEDAAENAKLREHMPFAVVGGTTLHTLLGRKVYARKNNWGVVEVENKQHSDFAYLRDMLIKTHMQDLIDVTALRHYELHRRKLLKSKIEEEEDKSAL